ncbi:MAG: hypothetical protein ACR2P6_04260 [Gammaproteobacteria bacterium]
MRAFFIVLCVAGGIGLPHMSSATTYQELRDRALEDCAAIDPDEYQTGLALNPEGYRSYYKQSACLQRAAVAFRDEWLCKQVRRRYALFSSSWGYSKANCLDLVARELEEDRLELTALRERYSSGPVKLVELRVEPNGNGRDFDFIPRFADGFEHGYQLELLLTEKSGTRHAILEHGSYLRGAEDNIRLYLPRSELLQRFPGLQFDRPYTLEAKLKLSIGLGGPAGWYRDDLVEEVFPESARTQIVITTVSFVSKGHQE